jgi:hypothetical protein
MSLAAVLEDQERRRDAARQGALLVDREVAARTGLRAAAMKAGYRALKAVKPGIVEELLHMLLPSFAPAVDPHWERAVSTGDPQRYFDQNAVAIAEALLSVTDARAARAKNRAILKIYQALRGQALTQTAQSVPSLPPFIERYVSSGSANG